MESKTIELDVREDINNKLEPFQKIMEAISELELNDIFVLHAPFKPVPLYGVMKAKGFEHEAEKVDTKHYKITFKKKEGNRMILDNRGLEPPQPMMRTLAALEELDKGQTLVIINDRRPMFLFEQLDEMGYLYLTEQQEDGSYKVTISRKAG